MKTTVVTVSNIDAEGFEPPRISGVVIGVLSALTSSRVPLVDFSGNPARGPISARSTATIDENQIGHQVALMFEQGDPRLPILLGPIEQPQALTAEVDSERVVFTAEREIILQCGEASITLTRAGKVLIRGSYLLSRSSGVNRIKGGSVQIN